MSEEIQKIIANKIEAAAKSIMPILTRAYLASVRAPEHKSSGLGLSIQYTPSTTYLFSSRQTMLLRPMLQASLSGRNKYIILAHPSMDHIKQLNCKFARAFGTHFLPWSC